MENKTPEEILDFHLSLSSIYPPTKNFYLAAMKYYGKQQYNQGVLDCIENAEVEKQFISTGDYSGHIRYAVNTKSMKKLIKQ